MLPLRNQLVYRWFRGFIAARSVSTSSVVRSGNSSVSGDAVAFVKRLRTDPVLVGAFVSFVGIAGYTWNDIRVTHTKMAKEAGIVYADRLKMSKK